MPFFDFLDGFRRIVPRVKPVVEHRQHFTGGQGCGFVSLWGVLGYPRKAPLCKGVDLYHFGGCSGTPEKTGPMMSTVQRRAGKNDLVSNRHFQPRRAPLVLSLSPSAELLVFKMGPVAGALLPRKGPIMQNMDPTAWKGPWFLKWGPLISEGPRAPGVTAAQKGAPSYTITGPAAWKGSLGFKCGAPWFLKRGPLIPEVGPLNYRSEAPGAPRAPAAR